jgi:hypothetical protein
MPRKKAEREERKCKMCDNTFECLPKNTKVYCSKKCANADPIIKEKMLASQKKVWKEKYNGVHPMTSEQTQIRHKETMMKRYGVEHALQSSAGTAKVKSTKLGRYGNENYNNIKLGKQTKLLRYGKETYNGFEKRAITKYKTIVESWKHLIPLFTEDEFTGVSNGQTYKFECTECRFQFERNLDNGYIPRCKSCAMKNNVNVQSKGEKELIEYIKSISTTTIIERDRTILNGKELDIYLPDLNLAIEFNGIYWHSESNLQNKMYHVKKTAQCAVRGIQLLHIYDYQWYQKQNVIKSLIASKVGRTTKIYARKCSIKIVKTSDKGEFLNATHIQGTCNSSVNLGLYYNNELIAIATFGKSRYDKKFEWELLRYSSKLNTTVVGGFSKLLKHFIKGYSPDNIMTYCDRNTSIGNLYLQTGFQLIGVTNPNYFYFKNANVYSREQFQKHTLKDKLATFDESLTEYQNMQVNGYDRVWDCGNYKFLLNISKEKELIS